MNTNYLIKTAIDEFTQRIGAQRETMSHRKIAGAEIVRAFPETRQLLKSRLAPLMRQFNITASRIQRQTSLPRSIPKRPLHRERAQQKQENSHQ